MVLVSIALTANVPELYKYHLQVGVYCLHHRLYGMYPYHFLTYLRNIYSKQEQQQVFENIVKVSHLCYDKNNDSDKKDKINDSDKKDKINDNDRAKDNDNDNDNATTPLQLFAFAPTGM